MLTTGCAGNSPDPEDKAEYNPALGSVVRGQTYPKQGCWKFTEGPDNAKFNCQCMYEFSGTKGTAWATPPRPLGEMCCTSCGFQPGDPFHISILSYEYCKAHFPGTEDTPAAHDQRQGR